MTEFVHKLLVEELLKTLEKRSADHRLQMAKGLPVEKYREYVGRHKECIALVDEVQELAEKFEATADE